VGVHFPQNDNKMAKDAVGIEIKIIKKSNLTMIESVNTKRYRITDYDGDANYAKAQEFTDFTFEHTFGKSREGADINPEDLLAAELYEMKNLWFVYNKKINSLLHILPQEVLNRYDLVIKSLTTPVFDKHKYPAKVTQAEMFHECVYKMG